MEIETLLTNAIACFLSLKGAADEYINALRKMKEASLKADNDLKATQSAADETISNLRNACVMRMHRSSVNMQRPAQRENGNLRTSKG